MRIARYRQMAESASANNARSSPSMGGPSPFAITSSVSLGLIWPSTEMRLKPLPAAARVAASRSSGSTQASVVTYASIVAMSGRIIPAPLAAAPMVTSPEVSASRKVPPFAKASVVRMASPKAVPPSEVSAAAAESMPAVSNFMGRRSPMTPVEHTARLPVGTPAAAAAVSPITRASAIPCSPVAALAQPLFTTTPRRPPGWSVRV